MKKLLFIIPILVILNLTNGFTQERYGKTANLGVGIGYYGYLLNSVPVLHFNYEFDVAKNFTLAPFITFYSYHYDYYSNGPKNGYKYYTYRRTVVPIGAKGTYYFDDILKASSKWDFYLGASLGLIVERETWSDGYEGDRGYYGSRSPIYLDLHIGTEYHFNDRIGAFLDLSSGVSTIGLAIHGKK